MAGSGCCGGNSDIVHRGAGIVTRAALAPPHACLTAEGVTPLERLPSRHAPLSSRLPPSLLGARAWREEEPRPSWGMKAAGVRGCPEPVQITPWACQCPVGPDPVALCVGYICSPTWH